MSTFSKPFSAALTNIRILFAALHESACGPFSDLPACRLFRHLWRLSGHRSANAARLRRYGSPDQQTAFDHRHQGVDQQREDREHEHPGKHAGDVEISFRRLDQVAEPGSGAEIFAHHGADHPLSISS